MPITTNAKQITITADVIQIMDIHIDVINKCIIFRVGKGYLQIPNDVSSFIAAEEKSVRLSGKDFYELALGIVVSGKTRYDDIAESSYKKLLAMGELNF